MIKFDRVSAKISQILNFSSLFLFLGLSFGVLSGNLASFDEGILGTIYSFRNPALTQIMYFVSFLGGEITLFSTFFIAMLLVLKKYKKEAGLFAFVVLSGLALNNFIKYFLKIPRPDIYPIFDIGSYAFPSGHAMSSIIFYGLLAYFIFYFTRNRGLRIIVATFSIVIILLIGFSRLYLGVHHPSDVLAGFLAGFWWLTTVILIVKNFTHRR